MEIYAFYATYVNINKLRQITISSLKLLKCNKDIWIPYNTNKFYSNILRFYQ